jgi:3-dehydroquinate synthase
MDPIRVETKSGSSTIMVGERLARLPRYLPKGRTIIITDEKVGALYRNQFPPADVITIGCGEKNKTLDTMASIYRQLIDLEADRATFIVGIGGGIVGDVTGFAASTYMRGLRFGFVASTLLGQVDATVGGKNGVNVDGYKNMVGVFNQPDFIIADTSLLQTLPREELASGLAEIVKHGCIASSDYFAYLENHWVQILALKADVLQKLVYDSICIKAKVVNQDEREQGERRKLNFGHTFGHAFEKIHGISHGAAVSAGMVAAARLSIHKGLLEAKALDRLQVLLERFDLPISVKSDPVTLFETLKKDKKRLGQALHFVLLTALGRAKVELIPLEELQTWLLENDGRR